MNDKQLYRLCKKYGRLALEWRWKFTGLLPEVKLRKLYEKKGFSSIYEFAAKLGGVSHEQVNRVIHVEEKLKDKPVLRAMLVQGNVSVNKLRHMAIVATPENEKTLAEQALRLSNRAVETLVKDIQFKNQIDSNKPKNGQQPGHVTDLEKRVVALGFNEKMVRQLENLKAKGFELNNLFDELLAKRDEEIANEKQEVQLALESKHDAALVNGRRATVGRAMPAAVKRIIEKEFGTKCAVPACMRQTEEVHHTARLSLSNNHDPFYLAPLCRGHHELAHSVDERVREKRGSQVFTRSD